MANKKAAARPLRRTRHKKQENHDFATNRLCTDLRQKIGVWQYMPKRMACESTRWLWTCLWTNRCATRCVPTWSSKHVSMDMSMDTPSCNTDPPFVYGHVYGQIGAQRVAFPRGPQTCVYGHVYGHTVVQHRPTTCLWTCLWTNRCATRCVPTWPSKNNSHGQNLCNNDCRNQQIEHGEASRHRGVCGWSNAAKPACL